MAPPVFTLNLFKTHAVGGFADQYEGREEACKFKVTSMSAACRQTANELINERGEAKWDAPNPLSVSLSICFSGRKERGEDRGDST